jgi:AcrR family transcriptional regulator
MTNSVHDEIADQTPRRQVARRTGRRPGQSGTREAILAAAQRQFARLGYDRTSIRAVAAEAGVDQKLVTHYFGSKQQLFVAAVELPVAPADLAAILTGNQRKLGERLARYVILELLDRPDARNSMTGVIRAAASEPEAARMVRELLMREIWSPAAELLGSDNAELRVTLLASQLFGLIMARCIVAAEPLASLPGERLAAAIAPTLHHYLTGPI